MPDPGVLRTQTRRQVIERGGEHERTRAITVVIEFQGCGLTSNPSTRRSNVIEIDPEPVSGPAIRVVPKRLTVQETIMRYPRNDQSGAQSSPGEGKNDMG